MANNQGNTNKTAEFFYKLCKISFLCGLPNLWINDLRMSRISVKSYRFFSQITTCLVYVFLIVELSAFVTKPNLTDKQHSDLFVFGTSHPMLWSYSVILSRKTRKIHKMLEQILQLTKVYNDEEVERDMLRKSKMFSVTFISSCMLFMVMFTVGGIIQFIKGSTFTTVIVAWPAVENDSVSANMARILWNYLWWALITRAMAVYAVIISLITNQSHQFIHLQKYFTNLNAIFDMESLTQMQKEIDYEQSFKDGIDYFNRILQLVHQSKTIYGTILSNQIIFNLLQVVLGLSQMLASDRSLVTIVAATFSLTGILMGTGLFMCSAGNITVEASKLAAAMYSSGWHNCQGRSSTNVRKLVVSSMMAAQRPVVIKGLGIMELSYQSFVSVVKSTYSLFTLIY